MVYFVRFLRRLLHVLDAWLAARIPPTPPMPLTLSALKSEIQNDPLQLGYAALVTAGNDSGVAALLNAKTYTQNVPVPLMQVVIWGAKTGALSALQAASVNTSSPAVQAIAIAALNLINGSFAATLDLGNADVAAMVDTLVAAGVMTAGQKTSLLALQSVPASRAEVLFGTGTLVDCYTVGHALRG